MKLKLAFIAATLLASQAAFAGDTYVGVGVGQSRLHADTGAFNKSTDLKDTAGKVFVGKELNRNFALEGSYFDLGDFSGKDRFGNRGEVGARGLGLDLVTTLPLTERFAVLGRVGVTRTRIDGAINGHGDHKNVTEPKAGIGLQYKLSDRLAVRGEYEAYRTNTSYAGFKEKSHVGVVGASLVYKFGAKPAYVAPVVYTAPAPVAAPVVQPAPAPVVEAPAPAPAPAPAVTKKKIRQ